MSKEKQIEEMALELCRPRNIVKMIHHRTCGHCDTSSCDIYELCVDLYNAGYRKQSEWISVEERLPEMQEEVLIYSECNGVRSACLLCVRDDIKTWFLYQNEKLSISVTHWMPLPDAPKGGAE